MNPQLLKLISIAAAPSRIIAGLMSGTSLDGLDIALCEFKEAGLETQVKVLHFITIPYEEAFKEELKAISFKETVELKKVTLLNAVMGAYTAKLILSTLKKWNFPAEKVDLIASHGQTIFHAPISLHQLQDYPNATLQIGDGDHIAQLTGVITLSDFRQKHIAAGGEGAPLAVYGDYLLFSSAVENRILLNIGGISNFTWLPSGRNTDQLFSTDIGPGNTLMDQFVQLHYPGQYYDKDAAIAKSGKADQLLVEALLNDPFFKRPFPRTTGPELFNINYLHQAMVTSGRLSLSNEDVLASLNEFTALSIVHAVQQTIATHTTTIDTSMTNGAPFEVYLSGGGMHNPLLVERIGAGLGISLKNTDSLGINPDAKEAVLFALLANECVAGDETYFGKKKGLPGVTMGKISLPG